MCVDLKIKEGNIYEVCQLEKQTKMSYKMIQHLTHASELPRMNFIRLKQEVVIEGKTDGQVGGLPNNEHPTVVQKKKLKKKNDYDIILPIGVTSHIFRVLINQNHDIVLGEVGIGVPLSRLNLSNKMCVLDISLCDILRVDKTDLVAGGKHA